MTIPYIYLAFFFISGIRPDIRIFCKLQMYNFFFRKKLKFSLNSRISGRISGQISIRYNPIEDEIWTVGDSVRSTLHQAQELQQVARRGEHAGRLGAAMWIRIILMRK